MQDPANYYSIPLQLCIHVFSLGNSKTVRGKALTAIIFQKLFHDAGHHIEVEGWTSLKDTVVLKDSISRQVE